MLGHYSDLVRASATDGASAVTSITNGQSTEDVDLLMDAWYRERQERIEAGLFLDEARELLRRIVSEGRITSMSRKKARRLLLAIKASGHDVSR
jgi:hypothetical protein